MRPLLTGLLVLALLPHHAPMPLLAQAAPPESDPLIGSDGASFGCPSDSIVWWMTGPEPD